MEEEAYYLVGFFLFFAALFFLGLGGVFSMRRRSASRSFSSGVSAMHQPLLGPKLKISRANHHIRDLESLLETFVCNNPYKAVTHHDPNGRGLKVTCQFGSPLPPDVPTIIGDAVHNLRAALDHLVADMVRDNRGTPGRGHGFPIYPDKTNFDGAFKNKLVGVKPQCVQFVEAQRPYADAGGNAWLYDLADLDNEDKHIVLTPTFRFGTIKRMALKLGEQTIGAWENVGVGGEGEVTFLDADIPGAKIEVDVDETPTVVFGDGTRAERRPVIATLRDLSSGVAKIVAEAKPLFS